MATKYVHLKSDKVILQGNSVKNNKTKLLLHFYARTAAHTRTHKHVYSTFKILLDLSLIIVFTL